MLKSGKKSYEELWSYLTFNTHKKTLNADTLRVLFNLQVYVANLSYDK
jgi:hypothetical protein